MFEAFRGRSGAPRAARPVPATSKAAGAERAPAPASPEVSTLADLPPYAAVLTSRGQKFFDEGTCASLAALLLAPEDGKNVLILGAAGSPGVSFLSLRVQLRGNGYRIVSEEPTRSPAALVQQLNAATDAVAPKATSEVRRQETSPHQSLWFDLLSLAVSVNASDVHLEVRTEEPSKVRLRVGGDLVDVETFVANLRNPARQLADMIGYLYGSMAVDGSCSDGDYKKEFDQSAAMAEIDVRDNQRKRLRRIRGRIQTMCSVGERPTEGLLAGVVSSDLVLRILFVDDRSIPDLGALGYLPSQIKALTDAVQRRGGLISISGRVGSGKSTTLRSLFAQLPRQWKKYALEDPSEYYHPGTTSLVVQRSGHDKAGAEVSFGEKLLALKRGDVDALLLGEIRDSVSMGAVRDITFSGHPVFTSMHADSALGQPPRMLTPEMGLSPFDVSDPAFLNTLVHQALVPKLCPHCALRGREAHAVLGATYLTLIERKFGVDPEPLRARNERGCDQCTTAGLPGLYGFAGRSVVAEWWTPDMEDRRLLRQRDDLAVRARFRESRCARFDEEDSRGKLAIEVGLYGALQGVFDPRTVEEKFWPWALHTVAAGGPREIERGDVDELGGRKAESGSALRVVA